MVTSLRSCMTASHFGNVPREVVNYHLIIVSKVGFYDLWISGVIEMMTPLNLFCFGDGGPDLDFYRKIGSDTLFDSMVWINCPHL